MSPISGVLLVDKPTGITSHDVVDQVRKIFKTRDVGHTGTLDPLATGLMVVTLGHANKLSQYLMDGEKGYLVTIRLGIETDTLDRTGVIVRESPIHLTNQLSVQKIQEEIRNLEGDLQLRVPDYSAVKVQGKKLYDLARSKNKVPDVMRTMSFWGIEIVSIKPPLLEVQFRCSKGAYVRSWVHELGKNLGCGAHLTELRRILNAPYKIEESLRIDSLTSMEKILSGSAFVPMEKILMDWPRLALLEEEVKLFRNGRLNAHIESEALRLNSRYIFVTSVEKILGFLEVEKEAQKVKIRRGFALTQ